MIDALAIDYATARPAGIRTLIGAEHHENGGMFFRTLACLPALTGPGPSGRRNRQERRLLHRCADRRRHLIRPDLGQVEGRRAPGR